MIALPPDKPSKPGEEFDEWRKMPGNQIYDWAPKPICHKPFPWAFTIVAIIVLALAVVVLANIGDMVRG